MKKGEGEKPLRTRPDKVTTANGLLYRGGRVIHLPEADTVAIAAGYTCAEDMVRALKKKGAR